MKGGKRIWGKLLHPPQWFYFAIAPVVFAALICLFALNQEDSALSYPLYTLSAYTLAVLLVAAPGAARRVRSAIGESRPIQKFSSTALGARYLQDAAFRNGMRLCHGVVFNLLYALFRLISGLHEASIWFVAIALYYWALGGLRGYLILGYYRRKICGPLYECRCYRRAAWLLFLLSLPMIGVIVLMVRADASFSYPGYMIYLSALYAFYAMIASVAHLVKFRKAVSPILSATKVLDVVAAMMSMLGLQSALLARFSSDGAYRQWMNASTGGCVYGLVILLAIGMLAHASKLQKRGECA